MSIEIKDLTKQYGSNITALNKISLGINQGIFGLLGRNGSGKTTLMRIIATLIEPTQGTVSVLGMPVNKKNQREIQRNIGYLPQEFGFYKEFTILEILEYICYLRGIEKTDSLIRSTLDSVNLYSYRHKKYKQLSGGMKRRVGLAQAMLTHPSILIVDEPTAGVDPEDRIKIRNFLSEYAEKNTVIFSTHIVEDIAYTCDKLAILDRGNLLYSGTIPQLRQMAEGKIYEATFDTLEDFKKFQLTHQVLSFKREENKTYAISICESNSSAISKLYQPSLEDAYMYITSRGAEKQWIQKD